MKAFTTHLTTLAIISLFTMASCSNQSDYSVLQSSMLDSIEELHQQITKDMKKAKTIIYNLPSPHEVALLLIDEQKMPYVGDILNPAEQHFSYETTMAQAMNLGAYCTDLSYASLYGQQQEVIAYMGASKKLADKLGILNIISDSTMVQLENNVNNRKQILRIMSEVLMNTEIYLQDNQRHEVLTMILIGGWIEGLYIATKLSDGALDHYFDLSLRVEEQQIALVSIEEMLKSHEQDESILRLRQQMTEIKSYFRQFSQSANHQDAVKNYGELCKQISKVRSNFTS